MTIIGIFCLMFPVVENLQAEDKPTLLKAIPLSQTAIQLQFDWELNAEEAENHLHYQITPDITMEMALLGNRPSRVLLFTSPMEIEKSYRLKLKITESEIDIKLPTENEITFGTGDNVTFSGGLQDTTLIVNKNRKTRNNNVGENQPSSVNHQEVYSLLPLTYTMHLKIWESETQIKCWMFQLAYIQIRMKLIPTILLSYVGFTPVARRKRNRQ